MSFSPFAQILIRIHRIIRILWQEIICTMYFAEREEFAAAALKIFGKFSKYARVAMNLPHATNTTGARGVASARSFARCNHASLGFRHTHTHIHTKTRAQTMPSARFNGSRILSEIKSNDYYYYCCF